MPSAHSTPKHHSTVIPEQTPGTTICAQAPSPYARFATLAPAIVTAVCAPCCIVAALGLPHGKTLVSIALQFCLAAATPCRGRRPPASADHAEVTHFAGPSLVDGNLPYGSRNCAFDLQEPFRSSQPSTCCPKHLTFCEFDPVLGPVQHATSPSYPYVIVADVFNITVTTRPPLRDVRTTHAPYRALRFSQAQISRPPLPQARLGMGHVFQQR